MTGLAFSTGLSSSCTTLCSLGVGFAFYTGLSSSCTTPCSTWVSSSSQWFVRSVGRSRGWRLVNWSYRRRGA